MDRKDIKITGPKYIKLISTVILLILVTASISTVQAGFSLEEVKESDSEINLHNISLERKSFDEEDTLDGIEVEWEIRSDSEEIEKVNTSLEVYDEGEDLVEETGRGPFEVNETLEPRALQYISDLPPGEYTLEMMLLDEDEEVKDTETRPFELGKVVDFTGEFYHEEKEGEDGLIDQLVFKSEIDCLKEDDYIIRGPLKSEETGEVKLLYQEATLEEGVNEVSFEVDGEDLYREKVGGEIYLEHLKIYRGALELEKADSPYQTQEYHYTDFVRPKVYFTGDFRSTARAENERGLFEKLSFEAEVEAQTSINSVTFTMDVYKEDGTYIDSLRKGHSLDEGTNWISVDLEGTKISEMEYKGSFLLSGMSIENITTTFDEWREDYTTTSYQYTDFAIPETELISVEDEGIDLDGSGLYDHLRITAEINIHEEGEYTLESTLESMFGRTIDVVQIETELESRRQTIEIDFEGSKIYEFGGSDTIFYIDLSLSRDGEPLIEEDRISTEEYHYEDFERPSVQVREVIQDEAKDTDGDGNFNELIFTIEFEVKEDGEGTHHIHSTLLDSQGIEEITSSVQEVSLSKGEDEVELSFAGKEIFSSREDGFILGTVSVYREDEIVVQESLNYHTSEDYSWEEFEPSKAYIVDVEENVETPNEEGEHPSLTFNVTVEVTDEGQGEYSIHLSLYTTEGYYITEETVTKELSEGTEVVQVKVSGEVFTTKQRDGPYEIRSLIIEHEDTNIDELREAHTTETYEWRDFEEVEDVDPLEVDDDSVFKGESLIYLISAISMIAAVAILVYYRKKVS